MKKFIDVSKNAECAAAVTWALENNVTSGTSETTFSPDDICSRGQIVTFLNRAINKKRQIGYPKQKTV
ncbi:MAG: S-layer homology domain-containing protein [Clostridia bacterium]|nr:S-layer homology domain-containing protein [Clostridia bacterium]